MDEHAERTPSTPESDDAAPAGAEGDARLREFARRRFGSPPPTLYFFPGALPPTLPFAVPLPPGARLVGAFTRGPVTYVLLDSDLSPAGVVAFYGEQLREAGWTQREVPVGFGFGGFVDDSIQGIFMEPSNLTFTKEAWAFVVEEPSYGGQAIAGPPTEVQLALYAVAPPHIRHGPRLREARPHAPSRFVPLLPPPAGARQRGMGGYGTVDVWHLPARLQTDLDLTAILAHYAQYLERVGWTRLDGEVCGVTAWSSWDVGDEDGEPWRGLFVALRWPEVPGAYLVELHVMWAGVESEAPSLGSR
jgi:hypothetical protein